jgi:class 3 adenylate cyclase
MHDFGLSHSEIKKIRDRELIHEIKHVLIITSNWMAIPLYLAFWVADLFYVPQYKWEFLLIRLTIIPICLVVQKLSIRINKLKDLQILAVSYSIALATLINVMLIFINDPTSSYYAGLNLVAVGCLSFLPLRWRYFIITALGIYLPYVLFTFIKLPSTENLNLVLVNYFFTTGTVVMCLLIRFFNEKLRQKEINSKVQLMQNIVERDQVIELKTKEAIRLNSLSNQFSPQVVRAIADGSVKLDSSVHRARICAIFIDIVGSTERVVRLDQEKIDLVLSRFMDTTVTSLLKYDLTIDKFQGDGILAFANDPIRRDDFVQRTCLAALEILEQIRGDQNFYIMTWKKEMQVRIGISVGYANVGFYGHKKFFKTYTAIGAPLPMASRLTNLALPNQILIDSDVTEVIKSIGFVTKNLGAQKIKGFEDDLNFIFELLGSQASEELRNLPVSVCANHPDSVLVLDVNNLGHYVMKCRICDSIQSKSQMVS